MICPSCGNESPDKRFCTRCGAPLEKVSDVGGSRPDTTTHALNKLRSKFPAPWIILAAALGLLIIGGAVAGIVLWQTSSGRNVTAKIESLELKRSDGKSLDLDKLPLDTKLVAQVAFHAQYPKGGNATLCIWVVDSKDRRVASDVKHPASKEGAQKDKLEFELILGDGKPMSACAKLEVSGSGDKATANKDLACTAVEGKGKKVKEKEVAAAREQATAKLQEAISAVDAIIGAGIQAEDLVAILETANQKLGSADTVEELIGEGDSVYTLAEGVISECNARAVAYQEEVKRQEEETKKQEENKKRSTCSTCGGSGKVTDVAPQDVWISCATCGGEGGWWMTDEMGYTGWVVCQDCNGNGGWWETHQVPVGERTCPTCGGKGWVSRIDSRPIAFKPDYPLISTVAPGSKGFNLTASEKRYG